VELWKTGDIQLVPTFSEEGATCHLVIAMVDNFGFRAGKTHPGFPPWFDKKYKALKKANNCSLLMTTAALSWMPPLMEER